MADTNTVYQSIQWQLASYALQGIIESGKLGEFLKIDPNFTSRYSANMARELMKQLGIVDNQSAEEHEYDVLWRMAGALMKSLLQWNGLGPLLQVDPAYVARTAIRLALDLKDKLGTKDEPAPSPGPTPPGPTPGHYLDINDTSALSGLLYFLYTDEE